MSHAHIWIYHIQAWHDVGLHINSISIYKHFQIFIAEIETTFKLGSYEDPLYITVMLICLFVCLPAIEGVTQNLKDESAEHHQTWSQ